MKKKLLYLSVLMILNSANAQKVYFIYMQTDSQMPFYVRMGEKIYDTGNSGYLVLSKLRDSTYSLNIGIKGSQIKEQLFTVTVNKKDHGFLLKNFGEEGWGLFDLQSFNIVKSETKIASNIVLTEKNEVNSFNELLAKAADDSSLMLKPVTKKAEENNNVNSGKIPETKVKSPSAIGPGSVNLKADEIKKTDSEYIKKEEVKNENKEEKIEVKSFDPGIEKKEANNLLKELYLRSIIVKHSESSTTEGFGLTFFDFLSNGTIDTINILIPETKRSLIMPEIKKGDKKFLDIDSAGIIQEKTNTLVIQKAESFDFTDKELQKTINCAIAATEDDFLVLKNKISKERSTENMIKEAANTFGTKCFTSALIRNLSSLFMTDEGKYKLFGAAYLHVSDINNFSSLQSEFKEDYYIRRFKAMLF